MVNRDVLQTVLQATPLRGREVVELRVPEPEDRAFAVQLSKGEIESAWRVARELVPRTGRWPLVTNLYGDPAIPFAKRIVELDLFSRFYFEEARDRGDVTPRGLIAASKKVDLDGFLATLRKESAARDGSSLEENLEWQLEDTRRRLGNAPTETEVRSARPGGRVIATELDLERFLLDWESAHGGPGDPSEARAQWFEDDQLALVWLPSAEPCDALAYISLYGAAYYGSQYFIALARRWYERYGAELVAHFGTMLEYFVLRPPRNLEDAFTVAEEHQLMAPCTMALSGTTIRFHAAGLVDYDRWFLHERP